MERKTKMLILKRVLLVSVSLLTVLALVAGCATLTPEVVERVVTQVVKETVEVEKVVTATPVAGPQEAICSTAW
jgi:hypothetical protein